MVNSVNKSIGEQREGLFFRDLKYLPQLGRKDVLGIKDIELELVLRQITVE